MKLARFMIPAVALAAMMFCGCFGSGGKTVSPSPTPAGQAANTPHAAQPGDYDNSVTVTDGRLEGSAFNWEFFLGKSGAGRAAEITLISTVNGVKEEMLLTGGTGSFTLKRASGETTFTYLLSFTADFEGESVSHAELCVLTDDPDLTAEAFFGGAVPTDARIGDVTEHGVVVYTDYR